jgi:hypothetical protein
LINLRRDVDFLSAKEAPIENLINSLSFIQNKQLISLFGLRSAYHEQKQWSQWRTVSERKA